MRRGYVALPAALCAAALVLTGCGESDPEAQQTRSAAPSPSDTPTSTPTTATSSSSSSSSSTSSSTSSSSSSSSSMSSAASSSSTSSTTTPRSTSPTASRTPRSSTSGPDGSATKTERPSAGSGDSGGGSDARTVRTGRPTRLQMPSLGFDQPVRALGLNNGAINPPPHVVQWYTGSVRPGSTGISVIAGHVAPYGGRAGIFSRLNDLSVGDTITIGYAGGGERKFRVYAKDAVGKTELQRDSRVWGSSSRPVVALITCDSSAPSRGGHSTRNYVVWASPV